MKTSQVGVDLIKKFEGCRLSAYKALPSEPYYTIGYGRYSPDIRADMTITLLQAERFLKEDLAKYEQAVGSLGLKLTQNQFDALVSFAYNCGVGNLRKLCQGRSLTEIANSIPKYNKAGGKVLAGLTRRRNAERELFLSGPTKIKGITEVAQEVLDNKWGTGAERKRRLIQSGYDYRAVQDEVNRLLKEKKS